jgi:hypothetical protein
MIVPSNLNEIHNVAIVRDHTCRFGADDESNQPIVKIAGAKL